MLVSTLKGLNIEIENKNYQSFISSTPVDVIKASGKFFIRCFANEAICNVLNAKLANGTQVMIEISKETYTAIIAEQQAAALPKVDVITVDLDGDILKLNTEDKELPKYKSETRKGEDISFGEVKGGDWC